MTYSKAIRELEADRTKVFESNSDIFGKMFHDDTLYLKAFGNYLEIQDSSHNNYSGVLNLNRVWTEVIQPVTLQEAFIAWANGKAIYCLVDGKYKYVYSNDDILVDDDGDVISSWEIEEGIWYIKGDK